MKMAAQYCLLSMAVMISFSTLNMAEVHPWPARKPDGTAEKGFEMVSDLFVNLALKDFRKAGQDVYRSVTVWV
jgi:hypothetical protein